jgi:hypothetical protein
VIFWGAGVALSLAAAAHGGLLEALIDGLVASPADAQLPPLTAFGVLALVVAPAVISVRRREAEADPSALLSLGFLLVAALGFASMAALVPLGLSPALRNQPAAAALLRTLALVGTALGFAALQRRARAPELAWAAYSMLGLAVLKLLLLDLLRDQPLSLVFTLSAIGVAVIALPRLLRRSS